MSDGSKKILIVEDVKPLTTILKRKLEEMGSKVEIAFDSDSAINILKKENFDLILLDLIIPKGSGFEVLEAIKKADNKAKVIVFTNLEKDKGYDKAKSLGVLEYYIKADYSMDELVKKVKGLTGA